MTSTCTILPVLNRGLNRPCLPMEIWRLILEHFKPSQEEYAVYQPWKRRGTTLSNLTQVCRDMRLLVLPLLWSCVYVETMKDWGILWKRISIESGQHIQAFINFWAIDRLPFLAMDDLEEGGKNLLWYAFENRNKNRLPAHSKLVRDASEEISRKMKEENYGNGPDGEGPDAIITSPDHFRQACKDVSATWSRKLHTIYWDSSTSFPEEVIFNIRQIQEREYAGDEDLGLRNLWIDYIERSDIRGYIIRSKTIFQEPIWKLGIKTLQNLTFFSVATPFWPSVSDTLRLFEQRHFCDKAMEMDFSQVPPSKPLESFSPNSGPGRMLGMMQSIHPRIFFCHSRAPFHCKELLPCWTRLSCVHIFGQVTMANKSDLAALELDPWTFLFKRGGTFYSQEDAPHTEPYEERLSDYLRAAIELRPHLELIHRSKGYRPITADDIVDHANSTTLHKEAKEIWHSENWKSLFKCNAWARCNTKFTSNQFSRQSTDHFGVYNDWLRDPELACKVAQSFNDDIEDKREVRLSYPFVHLSKDGDLYSDPDKYDIQSDQLWLDRTDLHFALKRLSGYRTSKRWPN